MGQLTASLVGIQYTPLNWLPVNWFSSLIESGGYGNTLNNDSVEVLCFEYTVWFLNVSSNKSKHEKRELIRPLNLL